ncbi:MAG: hypothetical protein R3B47_10895 [Bacteroidia bacterium]
MQLGGAEILMTPVQMANLAAIAIANGDGYWELPHFVRGIRSTGDEEGFASSATACNSGIAPAL